MSKYTYILFFTVSCILSVMMFFQIPDAFLFKVLMGVSAFSFEVGKIQLWIMWATSRNWIALFFSVLFICMSLLASTSFIVGILDAQFNVTSEINERVDVWESQINAVELEINSLTDAMNNTPGEWVTAKIRLSNKIADLRAIQSSLAVSRPVEVRNKTISDVFYTLGKMFKIDPKMVAILFFITFSVLLEAGAILLSPYKNEKVLREEKKQELSKIKKLSKVYSVGLELHNDDGTIKSMNELSTKLDMSIREVESILDFFKRRGLLQVRAGNYISVISKEDFLSKLRILEA